MKDFLGHNLYLNDKVVFQVPGYREFTVGEIIAFTPQKVRVEYKPNFMTERESFLQFPTQLIKVR